MTPAGIARFLSGHTVTKTKDRGWDRLANGDLLTVAEEAGFDLLFTTDKKIVAAVNAAKPGSYFEIEIPSK